MTLSFFLGILLKDDELLFTNPSPTKIGENDLPEMK